MKIKNRLLAAVAVLCAAGLIATVASASTRTSTGSAAAAASPTLSIAIDGDVDTLDPTFARTTQSRMVFANMCWKLYDINSALTIQPQLASALPTVSKDGLHVTIPLRHGVRFNDGTPFNANAVKATLERDISAPTSARVGELAPVQGVAALGSYKVRIDLKQPYAPLTAQLADRSGMIVSPTQVAKAGSDFGTSPICVGPYTFSNRVAGNSITLTKSPYFYGRAGVNVGTVVFKVVPDGTVRAALVRSGDIDVAISLAGPDLLAIRSSKNLELRAAKGLATYHMRINLANHGPNNPRTPYETPLAQHPELRKALELAIDRKVLNKVAYGGTVIPDCSPVATINPYHAANPPCLQPNVAQAKRLVQQSGVPTPISFNLMYLQGNDTQRAAQVIQSMVAAAGFNATLQPVDIPTAVQNETNGTYQVLLSYWSGRIDPDGNIYDFNSSHGSMDNTGATSASIDSLLDQGRSVSGFSARMKIYKKALAQIEDRRNILYLFHPKNYTGINRKVKGFLIFADNLPRAYKARIAG
jgi:peptide/nickel transport system substrate-binding protein